MTNSNSSGRTLRFYTLRDLDHPPLAQRLWTAQRDAMRVVGHVFAFRTNNYVVDELIDWDAVPDDPIFQLTFPQDGMLAPEDRMRISSALARNDRALTQRTAGEIRRALNPHPSGQLTHNVPNVGSTPVPGVQHKYRETCLVFPSAGQTCHAFCTFCFRWAQFV